MSLIPLLAASMAATTPSEAVVEVYREACVDGSLQLTPQRGELIDSTRLPDLIRYSDIPAQPRKIISIRMKQPSRTFVMIEQYDVGLHAKFETVCKVASTQLTEKDAGKAFFEGMAKPEVNRDLNPVRPLEPYVIDQPEAGVRKRLFVRGDWVMIETAIYRQAQ